MSAVVLSNVQSVDRFHSFIFADTAARAAHIYGLEFPYFECHPSEQQWFQDRIYTLLEAATRLQHLSFSTTCGDSVITAARKKTTLRELSVFASFNHPVVHELLTSLHSRLRSLRIQAYDPEEFPASYVHDKLSHFAPTLEVLQLDELPLDISASDIKTQFTSLRSLELESITGFAQLDVLLGLFPNLDNTLTLGELNEGLDHTHQALRERNKEAQKTHAWSCLERVSCDVPMAFVMALQCPIRRMHITSSVYGLRYLVDILHHNCPQQLCLPMKIFHDLTTLDGVFPPDAADRLTHLVLFFDFSIERSPADRQQGINLRWDNFIEMLVSSMKHLRLTHLRIIFHYEVFQTLSTRTRPNAVFPEENFISTARESDLHPAATSLVDAMPTLDYVFLTTCGRSYVPNGRSWITRNKWHSSKAWRVDHEASGLADPLLGLLVDLNADEAGVVIDREELELSAMEELN